MLIGVVIYAVKTLLALRLPVVKQAQGKKNGAPPLAAKCPAEGIDLRQMADQVDDLHTWLGARDETGAFPWAVGPVLAKLVEILNRMD